MWWLIFHFVLDVLMGLMIRSIELLANHDTKKRKNYGIPLNNMLNDVLKVTCLIQKSLAFSMLTTLITVAMMAIGKRGNFKMIESWTQSRSTFMVLVNLILRVKKRKISTQR